MAHEKGRAPPPLDWGGWVEGAGSCKQHSAILFPKPEYLLQGWSRDTDLDSERD